jgi:hypothetical protein
MEETVIAIGVSTALIVLVSLLFLGCRLYTISLVLAAFGGVFRVQYVKQFARSLKERRCL